MKAIEAHRIAENVNIQEAESLSLDPIFKEIEMRAKYGQFMATYTLRGKYANHAKTVVKRLEAEGYRVSIISGDEYDHLSISW